MPKRLPKGWVWTTLGGVCDINPSRLHHQASDDTDVSFVPMASVEEETGRMDASETRQLGEVKKGYTHFHENDVIFAKITPCMENGKIALASGLKNGLAFGSTEFVVFRALEGVLPRFVLYFLLQPTFRRSAQRQMTGVVGQKRVPTSWLAKHSFPLAPTKEQERIVLKLDHLLARIEAGQAALERARTRLKRYRDAVIDAAVSGELTRSWRMENDSSESAAGLLAHILESRQKRWEEEELNRLKLKGKTPKNDAWKERYRDATPADALAKPELPKGWVWSTITQLSWTSGYGTSVKCTFDASGPAILRIPNISKRQIDLSNLKFATDKKVLSATDFLTTGDFLIIRTNGSKDLIGRGAVITKQPEQQCGFASYLIRYRLLGTSGTWRWLSIAWDSQFLRDQIESKALTTAGQYNVSLSRLEGTAVPLPSLAEQKEIVKSVNARLKAADRLEARLTQSGTKARQQRETLLRNAFEGKLVSQNGNDKPGSAILHRVREIRDESRATKLSRKLRPKVEPPRVTGTSLLELINRIFRKAPFTFEDLQKAIPAEDYEKTKAELFELAQAPEPGESISPLGMSFNPKSGLIEFFFQAR